MTAINVFLRPDKAVLMTDAALYSPDGAILGFGAKSATIPHLRAAIAIRGISIAAHIFAFEASTIYRDFDEMIDRIPQTLEDWRNSYENRPELAGFDHIEATFVGWSERKNAPVGYSFQTRLEDAGEDVLEEIEGWVIGPDISDDEYRALERSGLDLLDDRAMRRFDPVRHGVPVMEAQRRDKVQLGLMREPLSVVGGHVCVTEIDRHGISQRVVHQWADVAGQPIEPAPMPEAGNILAMRVDRSRIDARRQKDKRARKAAQMNRRRA